MLKEGPYINTAKEFIFYPICYFPSIVNKMKLIVDSKRNAYTEA